MKSTVEDAESTPKDIKSTSPASKSTPPDRKSTPTEAKSTVKEAASTPKAIESTSPRTKSTPKTPPGSPPSQPNPPLSSREFPLSPPLALILVVLSQVLGLPGNAGGEIFFSSWEPVGGRLRNRGLIGFGGLRVGGYLVAFVLIFSRFRCLLAHALGLRAGPGDRMLLPQMSEIRARSRLSGLDIEKLAGFLLRMGLVRCSFSNEIDMELPAEVRGVSQRRGDEIVDMFCRLICNC